MELSFVGWREISIRPNKRTYIDWEDGIPVVNLNKLYYRDTTKTSESVCIVIFEYFEEYKQYFGIMTPKLSDIINTTDGTENRQSHLLLSAKQHLSNKYEEQNCFSFLLEHVINFISTN